MEGQLVVNRYCDFSSIFPKYNKDAYVSLFFPRPPLILSSIMLSFDSLSKLLQVLFTIFIFVYNLHLCLQSSSLFTIFIFVYNLHLCLQSSSLGSFDSEFCILFSFVFFDSENSGPFRR